MQENKLAAIERLLDIMDRLRVECPWDCAQTFESLRNNTIEETYELIDAIGEGDLNEVKKELGDLLLHIVFYSKIGEEQGVFSLEDVANGISDKLIYRHPHVFGEVVADNSQQVMKNWEQLKQSEVDRKGGVMSGVPKSLPAMVKAYRISQKAASSGFDWEKRQDVWAKVKEEIVETEVEIEKCDKEKMTEEFGDLFFALVNAARLYGVDPEAALESCNKKFIKRFNYIEESASKQGRSLSDLSSADMEALWQEAKK